MINAFIFFLKTRHYRHRCRQRRHHRRRLCRRRRRRRCCLEGGIESKKSLWRQQHVTIINFQRQTYFPIKTSHAPLW